MTVPSKFPAITLWLTALYLFACGASAVIYPELWLYSAGLPVEMTRELELVFGVAGVYLLALAYGAGRAAISPSTNRGIIAVLIVANILDCVVTLKAVIAGSLPILNGGAFVAVTIVWVIALLPSYRRSRNDLEIA